MKKSSLKETNKKERLNIYPIYLWVLSYYKPYIALLLISIICGIFVTAVQLSFPKAIQYFIDVVIPNKDIKLFWSVITLIGIGIVLMIGVTVIQNLLGRSIQEKAARDIQFTIIKQLRSLGVPYFEQRPIGESLSFLNTEVLALQKFYRDMFPDLIRRAIFSAVSIALLLSISWKLTLVIIPALLLYYLIGPYLERLAANEAKRNTDHRIQFNQKVYESISALGEIQVNNATSWDKQQVLTKLQNFLDSRVNMYFYAFCRGAVRRASSYVGVIIAIIYGMYLIKNGELTVGGISAFLMYYFQVMHNITGVITLVTEQKILMIQAEKIFNFTKVKPEVVDSLDSLELNNCQGNVVFKDVSFRYLNGAELIKNFNLSIHSGERVALVGESGGGKSTILKLLIRFYNVNQGEILIDNRPITRIPLSKLRETIGYVFQETYLFGSTIRDNIMFGQPESSEKEMIAAAKAAYAHDFIMELPDGYNTMVGERGVRLSGGQKQRISIARMLLKNPAIILLDEATSSLDHISEKEVQFALKQLLHGKTTITVAHRMSTILDYDKIAVIHHGTIVEVGTHEELLNKRGFYYQLISKKAEGLFYG